MSFFLFCFWSHLERSVTPQQETNYCAVLDGTQRGVLRIESNWSGGRAVFRVLSQVPKILYYEYEYLQHNTYKAILVERHYR